jgi:hypothetical protein
MLGVQRSESGDAVYLSAFKRTPPLNPEAPIPPVEPRKGVDGCSDDTGGYPLILTPFGHAFLCTVLMLCWSQLLCVPWQKSLCPCACGPTFANLCEI